MSRARHRLLLALTGLLLATVTVVPIATASAGSARQPAPKPAKLSFSALTLSLNGRRLTVTGRLSRVPAGASIQLQQHISGPWATVATARARRRSYALRWSIPASVRSVVFVRVRVRTRTRVLGSTGAADVLLPRPPALCAAPISPPAFLPPGDGWITGGAYVVGGPAPGIDACSESPYTVTATATGASAPLASQTVAGGDSYTLVLPAGSYTLMANDCSTFQPVTVTAGQQTKADVDCDVP
jgi:hypothetical protein